MLYGVWLQVMDDSESKEFQTSEVHEEHERMKSVTHFRERKRRKPAWREYQNHTDTQMDVY